MLKALEGLNTGSELHAVIEHRQLYFEKARYAWLIEKIHQLKLNHSKLVSEAEDRVLRNNCSWSEMLFTDMFGPDIGIIGALSTRINHIEESIVKFQDEARKLDRLINI